MAGRGPRSAGLALLALAAWLPAAARADPEPTETAAAPSDRELAEGLVLSARVSTPKKSRATCGETDSKGDIVVCGADRGEKWRVPSTTDSDPASREAQRTGIARAPNVSNLPDCSRGCIGFGKAPPRVYTIDLSKMPTAPADSDADKVARGEMAER